MDKYWNIDLIYWVVFRFLVFRGRFPRQLKEENKQNIEHNFVFLFRLNFGNVASIIAFAIVNKNLLIICIWIYLCKCVANSIFFWAHHLRVVLSIITTNIYRSREYRGTNKINIYRTLLSYI